MSKRKIKRGKVILLILIVIIILFVVFLFFKGNKAKPVASEVEVIDTIDDFGYELNDNETKYYNDLFNSLKELLSHDDYDEEEYAVIIAKLFLTDFYDLDNKVMKSDVGGTQFVYSSYREDFELGAIDSVYKYVESNVYGDRTQSLPFVKNVDKVSVTTDSFSYDDDIDYDAYYVTMDISYEKELGYPNKVSLVLIHNDNRLEIAKMSVI